eukprot:4152076-Pleurochrysis_carterae.AAC.1
MSSPAPAQQILTGGQVGAALTALSGAVREVVRAYNARPAEDKTTQPVPVDFTSLGLGWRSKGALSLFKRRTGGFISRKGGKSRGGRRAMDQSRFNCSRRQAAA